MGLSFVATPARCVLHSHAHNPAVPAWAVSFWSLKPVLHSRVPALKVMLEAAAAPQPDTPVVGF